eukprot:TRINITY_DN29534_c0_g1_i1.p5 TRINITY_DN29534_c0_g1~~TRINITY_DN29534_c0_g1_i1.p5  ORF type:complete len:109 (-),score=9.01 TRINITY_DN29534_c0_g1_i1:79-405(-)
MFCSRLVLEQFRVVMIEQISRYFAIVQFMIINFIQKTQYVLYCTISKRVASGVCLWCMQVRLGYLFQQGKLVQLVVFQQNGVAGLEGCGVDLSSQQFSSSGKKGSSQQ